MRTLHIDTGREMAGGQWQALYLLERLPDATLLARNKSPLFQQAKCRGIDVRPLSLPLLYSMARQCDLVHAHDARAHTLATALPRPPLIVARRVAFPVSTALPSRIKYARGSLYLTISQCVASQLEAAGIAAQKIRVVSDGVPLVEAAHGDQIIALPAKQPDLIRRAADLAGAAVRFATNLWEDLSKAKMFLYASEMEGLGSAALAAMSAGVPVIASNIGGLREAVEHERTGLLVENRPEDFAAAIARLLRDPERAAEMGTRGRQRIEQFFTIEKMAAATIAAYQDVLR